MSVEQEERLSLTQLGETDLFVSEIGFGTAPLGNRFKAISANDARDICELLPQLAVSYVDTAPMYGQGLAEHRVGEFLRGQHRPDYIVSTKVGRLLEPQNEISNSLPDHVDPLPFNIRFDYSYEGAVRSIEDSLQRLGTNYIDIALIHDCDVVTHGRNQPAVFMQAAEGAFRALRDLKKAGVVGAVGLGVNEWRVCDALLNFGEVDCFLLAREFSLLGSRSVEPFLNRCLARSVSLIAGGVFNGGILATGAKSNAVYNYRPAEPAVLERVKAIQLVCEKFATPLAAVAIQYVTRHPAVASAVVGASRAKQLSETVALAKVDIPVELWKCLYDKNLIQVSMDHMLSS
ncbi:aldo/keto reductase [Roseibium sp. M-1]